MAHCFSPASHRRQRYKLIAGAIVPRPIALVTTLNEDGSCNAAPFSAFNCNGLHRARIYFFAACSIALNFSAT